MKRNKSNMIKVLEAMKDNAYSIADIQQDLNKLGNAERSRGEAYGIWEAIEVLQNPEYFNEMVKIFDITED